MSEQWSRFSPSEKQTAAEVFAVLSARAALTSPADDGAAGEPRPGFSHLYAFVTRPDYRPPRGFFEAIEAEPRLRRTLDALMERDALCRFGLAEVASTGDVSRREAGAYAIHLQESRAISGRTIVVIEIRDPEARAPRTIFAHARNGVSHKHSLPEAEAGRVQFMVANDSALLATLRDPNASVTLR